MSEFLDRISKLSPQRLALLADELNERVQEAERRRRVPIAIVGIGCRLPGGVHDPEGFWNLLRDGVDAISEVPSSRWNAEEFYDSNPDTPGKMATRWGGFIEDPDQFDPKFFGIAPAEATSMDPQQRLLLETAWEALEHAGIAPSRLTGTATGVFVGICNGDYGQVALNAPRETITAYFAPGLSHAVAAGRISYVLGLQGPSMAVDTSCSASLVAVHLACQSLRLEESDTALAGGVNLILNQDVTIALSQSKMMAPDGRCKAFSDCANGFVRSEGCGMIVLKRLPDAIRDGNRVLAVIRGSACNQDGRSSGLTAPNGPSQEAVVSSALSNAGMQPDEVDYIEAHGTGTSLGDPIEAGALNAVFASRSIKSEPLYLGSVKTNLGHLESAAGIAGLIKLVLSIQNGKIPASLHLKKPNSRIEWDRLPLKVPTRLEPWNRRGEKRVGGISSFGFSGTNAHVVVEEYFDRTPPTKDRDRIFPFTLSAKTQSALEMMVRRLHDHLTDHPAVSLADVAHTLNQGRSHFEYRAAGTAGSHAELLALLSGVRNNDVGAGIQTGRVIGHFPRVAFVFGGNGLHEANIGRELYDAAPVFRESLQRCEQILGNDLEQPLTSVLYPEIPAGNQTRNGKSDLPSPYRAAADFSLQYALAELWRACGIEPSVVWGYGIGEYVAACIAGVFSLEDGLRLAIAHGDETSGEFEERARRISYQSPRIPLIPNSNAKEKFEVDSAEYWLQRLSELAPFSSALSALTKEGSAANIYIGDSAGFQQFAKSIGNKLDGKWLPSLGKDESDCRQFLNAAASLYLLGCELHIDTFYGNAAKTVSLPTYPFERERYWIESENRGPGAEMKNLPANAVIDGTAYSAADGDEWIYDLVWEPKPLPSKMEERTAGGFNAGLTERMASPQSNPELMHYAGFSAQLDSVCVTYIAQALVKMGADSLPQRVLTLEELCRALKVTAPRQRLFERLLSILAEDGLVDHTGDAFRLNNFAANFEKSPTPAEPLRKLREVYPECQTEMNVLQRCGENLAGVLLGRTDPVHLLFPNNSMEEAERIYSHSPVARFYNKTIADLVRTSAGEISGRTVRILEIGAGTGSTTASVLPGLAAENIEYVFTDVSPTFVSRARGKFSDFASVKYQVLNIETDPIQQGFELDRYDIIIAANVLHATADLRRTISHIRQLLVPGGVLLLLEGIRPDRAVDLTFGLTDGWWRFTDHDVRADYPLVSADTWSHHLGEVGMTSTRTMSYAAGDDLPSQQMLIVAQASPRQRMQTTSPREAMRRWIVLADKFGIGSALKQLLTDSGRSCEMIPCPHSAGELEAVLSKLEHRLDNESVEIEIVYLWGIDVSGSDLSKAGSLDDLHRGAELCVKTPTDLLQVILKRKGSAARVWFATRGSQATGSFSPSIGGATQSMIWGVGRVLGLEAPEKYGALIDVDPAQTPEKAAASLLAELLAEDIEDQVAYRDGKRLVARLRNTRLEISTSKASVWHGLRADGSYLITGGLGGIGLRLATWAAAQGARHLVLLGRTGTGSNAGPFAAERLRAIAEIKTRGTAVTVVEGDVASETDMKVLFGRFGEELPTLRGVIHAAAALNSAGLADLTDEQIEIMLRPKVLGTWVLHELTRSMDLDFFLAFSSAASLLGVKGMAHYAAANQFLDSFAHYRRAVGLPMLSVNWGAWDVMRLFSAKEQSRFGETGQLPMNSEQLFELIGKLTGSARAQVMIANVDWDVLKPILEANRVRPMLEGFGNRHPARINTDASPVSMPASLHAAIGMALEGRRKFIEAFTLRQAAQVLGFRGGDLPPVDIPLTDLGLDSLMAVDLKNRLQTGLGQELSPTVVFDYPTVSGMVEMLETRLWAAHGNAEGELVSALKEEIRI